MLHIWSLGKAMWIFFLRIHPVAWVRWPFKKNDPFLMHRKQMYRLVTAVNQGTQWNHDVEVALQWPRTKKGTLYKSTRTLTGQVHVMTWTRTGSGKSLFPVAVFDSFFNRWTKYSKGCIVYMLCVSPLAPPSQCWMCSNRVVSLRFVLSSEPSLTEPPQHWNMGGRGRALHYILRLYCPSTVGECTPTPRNRNW